MHSVSFNAVQHYGNRISPKFGNTDVPPKPADPSPGERAGSNDTVTLVAPSHPALLTDSVITFDEPRDGKFSLLELLAAAAITNQPRTQFVPLSLAELKAKLEQGEALAAPEGQKTHLTITLPKEDVQGTLDAIIAHPGFETLLKADKGTTLVFNDFEDNAAARDKLNAAFNKLCPEGTKHPTIATLQVDLHKSFEAGGPLSDAFLRRLKPIFMKPLSAEVLAKIAERRAASGKSGIIGGGPGAMVATHDDSTPSERIAWDVRRRTLEEKVLGQQGAALVARTLECFLKKPITGGGPGAMGPVSGGAGDQEPVSLGDRITAFENENPVATGGGTDDKKPQEPPK